MQELYKGNSRSPGGKMVSGDSKGSGAEYTHGSQSQGSKSWYAT